MNLLRVWISMDYLSKEKQMLLVDSIKPDLKYMFL